MSGPNGKDDIRVPKVDTPTKIRSMSSGKSGGDILRAIEEMEPIQEKPTVDVLMAVYNTQPDHIAACLHTIRRQNYPNIGQIVICDDGSTDRETRKYLKKVEKQWDYDIIWKDHGGASSAYNELFRAVGKDVGYAFLVGSDDMVSYEFVNAIMSCMTNQPEIMGMGAFCVVIDEEHNPIRKWPVMGAPIWNMDVFHRYDLWWDENLDKWVDEDLFQRTKRAVGREDCFRVAREFLYYYRFHGSNITGRINELEKLKKGKLAYESSRKMAVMSLRREELGRQFAAMMRATYIPAEGDIMEYPSLYFIGFGDPGMANMLPQLKNAEKHIAIHWFKEDLEALDYHPSIKKIIAANVDANIADTKGVREELENRGIPVKGTLALKMLSSKDQLYIFRQRWFYLVHGIKQVMQ